MKTRIFPLFLKTALVGSLALTSGCDKDDKKEKVVTIQAQSITTAINGKEEKEGEVRIKYSSNVENATFQCQVEQDGNMGDWESCPAGETTVPTQAGVSYRFKVKAVGPDGKEATPYEISFQGKGAEDEQPEQPAQPEQPEEPTEGSLEGEFQVVILGKENIGQVFNHTGAAVNLNDLRFECKREYELSYRRCPAGNGYSFTNMIDGSTYSLMVRAYHTPTKSWAKDENGDMLEFQIKLPSLTVIGKEQLEQSTEGIKQIAFDQNTLGGLGVFCALDDAQATDCTLGYTVNLDDENMAPGPHKLTITSRDSQGAVVATEIINFCAKTCQTGGEGGEGGEGEQPGEPVPLIQDFLVGNFYIYSVPEHMHVTEYATNKNAFNRLQFYRISPQSDPNYIGNYACDGVFDNRFSPDDLKVYCETTPPVEDIYKWLTDYRLANNHIEVGTSPEAIDQGARNERVMINVFDRDYDYVRGRSRFEQLCLNRRGAITRSPFPIRVMRNFWGEPVRAEVWTCTVDLAGRVGTNALPGIQQWQVAGFFITNDGADLPLPDLSCFDFEACPCQNPNLLEVVYMQEGYMQPEDFMQKAQRAFMNNLFEAQPN